MPSTWFTSYRGAWDPRRARENFTRGNPNDYANIIQAIRQWFFLEKTNTVGVERGTGMPRMYPEFQVYIDEFKWGDFARVQDEWQPVLQFKMRMFTQPQRMLRRVLAPQLIMDYWVEIRFDPQWPHRPPNIRIQDPRYTEFHGDMHNNHMYSNGWVCFFAGSGDWSSKDTIISFIQAFFDWAKWHHDKFGW